MVQILKPHPALAPFVLVYATTQGFFPNPENHILSARGAPMLIFPYKSPSATSYRYGTENGMFYPRPLLDKPALLTSTDMFSQSHFSGSIHFVMVLLQMTGACHFLRSGVKGLANHVDLLENYGVPHFFDELQDRLWQVGEPKAATALVEQYLIRHFYQKKALNLNDLTPVSDYMMRMPPGSMTVKDIAQKFRCSESWLERRFALQTGMTPKTWLRLLRFRAAASYWERNPGCSLMEIAVRFRYNDSPHLTRDFHEFAGGPPALHFEQHGHSESMLGINRSQLFGNHNDDA